jgi:hypothetical protein
VNDVHEVPIEVNTDTEDDGEDGGMVVSAHLTGDGPINWAANAFIPAEHITDELVAHALLQVSLSVASSHSAGAWMALQSLLTQYGRETGPTS